MRNVLAMTTPLPFRFGTLVTEAGLRSYVTSRKAALEDRLEVVKDSVEMSIKVIWQNVVDDDESPAISRTLASGPHSWSPNVRNCLAMSDSLGDLRKRGLAERSELRSGEKGKHLGSP